MTCLRAATLCMVLVILLEVVHGLMLQRLPRHIPRNKVRMSHDASVDEEDLAGDSSFSDHSVEKKRIIGDPNQLNAFMKPTWKAIYPFTQSARTHQKRAASTIDEPSQTSENDRKELANILRDDDGEEDKPDKKKKKDVVPGKRTKAKRQSRAIDVAAMEESPKDGDEHEQTVAQTEDFQDWLRREYYRNMAKSFASMRRKRDSPIPKPIIHKRSKKSVQQGPTSLIEITDNLRMIEDQLFQDALQTMRDEGGEYDDDGHRQTRISNDLSLAYDLETMRNAFFRLKETLANMENEEAMDVQEMYHTSRKRSRDCPALDQLTSDCSTLSDIMPEGTLKRLLLRACNWHEVCYTCGKAFGLTSESCDGSFIEQTQTICRNDAPCESTASLLVVPLRQRRVFYKRSNPDVCIEEACVENFLKEGLAAMEEGRYTETNGQP